MVIFFFCYLLLSFLLGMVKRYRISLIFLLVWCSLLFFSFLVTISGFPSFLSIPGRYRLGRLRYLLRHLLCFIVRCMSFVWLFNFAAIHGFGLSSSLLPVMVFGFLSILLLQNFFKGIFVSMFLSFVDILLYSLILPFFAMMVLDLLSLYIISSFKISSKT